MALIRVFSPDSESELAVVLSMLEAHEIPCFVHGRNIGSLYPGLQINAYNTQTVMVPEEHARDALESVRVYREADSTAESAPAMTWRDKLRILAEGLVFGWFIPGRRLSKDKPYGRAGDA